MIERAQGVSSRFGNAEQSMTPQSSCGSVSEAQIHRDPPGVGEARILKGALTGC
jgi:hypothetical protein